MKICHAVGPGAKAGVGPEQNNLVGSVAGRVRDIIILRP